jgi:putative CocE/NonD family hydrolase
LFQEGKDGYDMVEWLAKQPWSNGRVGMAGLSYLGSVQWLAAREHPPHLTCIAPTAPAGRYLNEVPAIGGAWLMEWALQWTLGRQGRMNQQGAILTGVDWKRILEHRPLLTMDSLIGPPNRLYREWMRHPTLDAYWRRIQFTRSDFERITIPTLTTTGWFDDDQPGALFYWENIRALSPAKDKHWLVAGPWNHMQTFVGGDTALAGFSFTPDAAIDNKALHVRFFDWCLKGAAPAFDQPRVQLFVTGSNEWRDFDEYPVREATSRAFYLHSNGGANTLRGDGRLSAVLPDGEPVDTFTYQPRMPVPSLASGDQREIEARPDVLVYTSVPLAERLDVIGRVTVELFAATDARDTDWTGKLVDVFPDGRALKLGRTPAGVIRARYRQGLDRERMLTPGRVERYVIDLDAIGHSFLPGHRVRLEISSSASPYVNPNQNTGNPVATDTVWRSARQTIHHDRVRPSKLVLPVMAPKTPTP